MAGKGVLVCRMMSIRKWSTNFKFRTLKYQWVLCEYVIAHTNLPPSPVILWIELDGQAKMASIEIWIPWSKSYRPHSDQLATTSNSSWAYYPTQWCLQTGSHSDNKAACKTQLDNSNSPWYCMVGQHKVIKTCAHTDTHTDMDACIRKQFQVKQTNTHQHCLQKANWRSLASICDRAVDGCLSVKPKQQRCHLFRGPRPDLQPLWTSPPSKSTPQSQDHGSEQSFQKHPPLPTLQCYPGWNKKKKKKKKRGRDIPLRILQKLHKACMLSAKEIKVVIPSDPIADKKYIPAFSPDSRHHQQTTPTSVDSRSAVVLQAILSGTC